MLNIAGDLLVVFAFSFATGIGPYALIVPKSLRTPYMLVALPVGLGLLQLSIVTGYCIYASAPIVLALRTSAVIALLTVTIALAKGLLKPRSALEAFTNWNASPASVRFRLIGKLAIGTLAMLIVLWPALRAGEATTPYRVGIDQVGYAEAAQYLVEGGTLANARRQIQAELDVNELKKAERQNYKDIRLETYIDTEFLLKADRWGYPGSLAALTILTHNEHVFRLEFLMLSLSYGLLLAVVYHIARRTLSLPSTYSIFVTLAIAFNCNLLNVYYEGQLAQVFCLGFFLLVLVIFAETRSGLASLKHLRSHDSIQSIALVAMLTAGLFSAFNECLVLIFAMLACCIGLDIILFRGTSVRAICIQLAGLGLGFILVFPFSYQWISYTVANLSGLSRAGFWQAHWASFAEMLGLFDMYQIPGYAEVRRSAFEVDLNMGFSVVAFVLVAQFFKTNRQIDLSFWLAAPILVTAEYVKSHYVDDILNYPFMKLYTMFVPLLVCITCAALFALTRKGRVFGSIFRLATICFVIGTGCAYIVRYSAQGSYVSEDMFALYKFDGARRFDRYAILTRHNDIRQYMYVPLTSMRWVDEAGTQKFLARDLDRPLLVEVRQEDVACRECVGRYFAGHTIYEDPTMLLIDTGLTLGDVCSPDVRRESVASLGYDSQQVWHTELRALDGSYLSSYRQCDFGYVAKLIARSLGPA